MIGAEESAEPKMDTDDAGPNDMARMRDIVKKSKKKKQKKLCK